MHYRSDTWSELLEQSEPNKVTLAHSIQDETTIPFVHDARSTGEIQKGTGGRGRDRKCRKLSRIVVTFYDEFYDVLCQWNKETEIVTKCRKVS